MEVTISALAILLTLVLLLTIPALYLSASAMQRSLAAIEQEQARHHRVTEQLLADIRDLLEP